jgi:hypothetical protein
LPQLVSQRRDFSVAEGRDSVSVPLRLCRQVGLLPGKFMSGLVILFPMGLRRNAVIVGGGVM